ncbi:acyl-CoA transferase [Allopusillimonas ginsengisoli]|nr:acyl-CoA transferase [Allopusillimonas ginsengisoli]
MQPCAPPTSPHLPVLLGQGSLQSAFAVTPLAVAAIGTAAQALADYVDASFGRRPDVAVDRRLASLWFGTSLRPQGWRLPDVRDPITGDYRTRDGWLRIHANAPHHRTAAIAVLGCAPDHQAVANAVAHWDAQALEDALVQAHACAAAMHSRTSWAEHPQGKAVAAEPVFRCSRHERDAGLRHNGTSQRRTLASPGRPLAGLRVLDLTRVLAGPVSTRFLAGYGATVLRIDPPWWTEPGMVPEVTLGKRCAELDLRDGQQLELLRSLLAEADVMIHGYRPDALARLGLGERERQAIRPGLVDVCLDAYGWTGPWQSRRGFDSLVQLSNGIAHAGMEYFNKDIPTPLPVQALDQATGYLMAAAALQGLTNRLHDGHGTTMQLSLACTGELLASQQAIRTSALTPETDADLAPAIEMTSWGPAQRLVPPCWIEGIPMHWDVPASALRESTPQWP